MAPHTDHPYPAPRDSTSRDSTPRDSDPREPAKSVRGFAAVALDQPRHLENLGGALRAAAVYEASLVVVNTPRFPERTTDTTKAHRHIPLIVTDDIFSHLPLDTTAVAVDFIQGATPLHQYKHPERAFYIFGGENRTLDETVVAKCPHKVFIPTLVSMNLAATVNVVLYDRSAKRNTWPSKRVVRREAPAPKVVAKSVAKPVPNPATKSIANPATKSPATKPIPTTATKQNKIKVVAAR